MFVIREFIIKIHCVGVQNLLRKRCYRYIRQNTLLETAQKPAGKYKIQNYNYNFLTLLKQAMEVPKSVRFD